MGNIGLAIWLAANFMDSPFKSKDAFMRNLSYSLGDKYWEAGKGPSHYNPMELKQTPRPVIHYNIKLGDKLMEKGVKKRTAMVITRGQTWFVARVYEGKYQGDRITIAYNSVGKSWTLL